jgi:hypothetical protein
MFPELPVPVDAVPIPRDVNGRPYTDLDRLMPILVRKSSQSSWSAVADHDVAAQEVFSEPDGIHSFFRVGTPNALAAVAAFMTKHQSKRRVAYFFALPEQLVLDHELAVTFAPIEHSNCKPLSELHRHVEISEDRKERLFREIQEAQLFNYRVDRNAMSRMEDLLRTWNCLDYMVGPCFCES